MTDKYPRGKLNDQDEGALTTAIGIEKDCVVIKWNKPVAWIGMPKDMAIEFASTIIKQASKLP